MRGVSEGLAITFEVLSDTRNESAIRALLPALDSSRETIQLGVLTTLLARRSFLGGREILRRLDTMPASWKAILRRRHGQLGAVLRDSILGTDPHLFKNACNAAVWFREYDLIPTLLSALEDLDNDQPDLLAETLSDLVNQLYEELEGRRSPLDMRDPKLVRRYVLESLERSVKRFEKHQRREILNAFLLLAGHGNSAMTWILQNPHHTVYRETAELLCESLYEGHMRLLISFLDQSRPPPALLAAIARRTDRIFIEALLARIGLEPPATIRANLKRISSFAFIEGDEMLTLLRRFGGKQQGAIVELAMASGIPRPQAFKVVEGLLKYGKPEGRRQAAAVLAKFNGVEANALALQALDDVDPIVQANIIRHLRRRRIPGVLARLVDLVDSPHDTVRYAVRESLGDFSFERYLNSFEMLDEDLQRNTGMLVKKIDPETLPLLKGELLSPIRSHRLRGLDVVRTIDLAEPLEDLIIALLQDEDHIVRSEAAATLALCTTLASHEALQKATEDSSTAVREAALKSLNEHSQFVR